MNRRIAKKQLKKATENCKIGDKMTWSVAKENISKNTINRLENRLGGKISGNKRVINVLKELSESTKDITLKAKVISETCVVI
jgi:hypothetical protein